ncbi:MAG: ABC transporter ATP-binding protein [Acidimicrobiia bacterium]
MPDTMIRLEAVSKTFPGSATPAVEDLSLEIPRGEIAVLVGPSGCGKTTTLKMINRIIEPTSGTIWVDGANAMDAEPHVLRRSIGYVIQQVGLFPHRTIAQNIGTVPELLGWEKARISERVDELVELVGLEAGMRSRYPTELSGGQQQRVGVARALAADPPVLLMDEPFGAVDPIVRARLQDELLSLQDQVRKTIVFVTHDIDEAIRLGDRVAILNVGGKLEQYDTPNQILREPANEFVAQFLGSDRGLKRLSLIPVAQVDLEAGPMVDRSDTVGKARAVMDENGVDWVGVLDGDRVLGWSWGSELDEKTTVGEARMRPFRVSIQATASLREALDAIVNTRNQVAVVCNGDRYLGMLFVEQVSGELLR